MKSVHFRKSDCFKKSHQGSRLPPPSVRPSVSRNLGDHRPRPLLRPARRAWEPLVEVMIPMIFSRFRSIHFGKDRTIPDQPGRPRCPKRLIRQKDGTCSRLRCSRPVRCLMPPRCFAARVPSVRFFFLFRDVRSCSRKRRRANVGCRTIRVQFLLGVMADRAAKVHLSWSRSLRDHPSPPPGR